MARDFTLTKYNEICEIIINSNYKPISVLEYILRKPNKFVILRHDVDRKVNMALKMAQLEYSLGIISTYYFRKTSEVYRPEIIKQIKELGHEIGFHYEVLDKAKGDIDVAMKIFQYELDEFRKIAQINTVCMHGNPWTQWINLDIWKKYDFQDFDIIGEPYLSIDFNKVVYFTDTGRNWANRYNVKDNTGVKNHNIEEIRKTDELINFIKNEKAMQICISTHPNRWTDDFIYWFNELWLQKTKNIGKAMIKYYKNNRSQIS